MTDHERTSSTGHEYEHEDPSCFDAGFVPPEPGKRTLRDQSGKPTWGRFTTSRTLASS